MKTQHHHSLCVLGIAAATGIAMSGHAPRASSAQRDLAGRSGDMVEPRPPSPPVALGLEPTVTKSTTLGEVQSIGNVGAPVVRVIGDQGKGVGVAATGLAEAPVFLMDNACASAYVYGVLLMDDSDGNLTAHRVSFGNGFEVGQTELVAHEMDVFVSSSGFPDDTQTTEVTLELWDGDPVGYFDTICSAGGVPAPIPNTACTFSGLLRGTNYTLRCEIPNTVINCDHVFQVLHVVNGCQVSANIPCATDPQDPADMFQRPPDVGGGNAWESVFACEQAQACGPSRNQWGIGVCCEDNAIACDHTDGTYECFRQRHCGDNVFDYFIATYDIAPPTYYNFIGGVYANTDRYISLTPVSADVPPDQHPTPDGWRIVGNEIVLANPDRPVWLELRIADWDPDDMGILAYAYQAGIDESSFSNATGEEPPEPPLECTDTAECAANVAPISECELPPDCALAGLNCVECAAIGMPCTCTPIPRRALSLYTGPCTADAECVDLVGPASYCNVIGADWIPPNACAPGYIDRWRSDYVFANEWSLGGVGYCGGVLCISATMHSYGMPSPGHETYGGTLALWVPPEATGTFTVKLHPATWQTALFGVDDHNLPLVGTLPAKITIGGSVIDPLVAKSRYLSFVSSTAGTETALRATFTDLPAPYDAWNGVQMWVGPPKEYCENSGQTTPPPEGCGPAPGLTRTFLASTLQCEQYYRDWGALEAVHVFHEGIVSVAAYDIQSIDIGEDPSVESNYSGPTSLTTSRWCDLVKDCTTNPCGPPDGRVDITTDVTALVDKYRNLPGAVMQVRADLVGVFVMAVPDQKTTMLDLTAAIDAFRGAGYPFAPGPRPCPP